MPRERQSPTEIEVTPAMIEAGVLKLYDYSPQFSNERDIVRAIFLEMISAQGHLSLKGH